MTELKDPGQVVAPGTIRFERQLPGPISKAWSFLVDADKRALWLAGGEIEARVGGRVELLFRHDDLSPKSAPLPERYAQDGTGSQLSGKVTAFEPPRLLAFTWHDDQDSPSEVIFELEEAGEATRLILTHRRLTDRPAELANVGAGWHTHLGILVERLAGRIPEPFFAEFDATEQKYARLVTQRFLADE